MQALLHKQPCATLSEDPPGPNHNKGDSQARVLQQSVEAGSTGSQWSTAPPPIAAAGGACGVPREALRRARAVLSGQRAAATAHSSRAAEPDIFSVSKTACTAGAHKVHVAHSRNDSEGNLAQPWRFEADGVSCS